MCVRRFYEDFLLAGVLIFNVSYESGPTQDGPVRALKAFLFASRWQVFQATHMIGTNRELSIFIERSTHTTRTSRRTSSLSVTLYRVVYYRSQRESLGVCGVRGGCGARAVEGEQYDVPALW